MIDVDYFKKVNDTFGHAVGDLVLQEVVNCYRRNVRVADIVGRYGGEEFVLMLPDTPLLNAELLAERLRKEVAELRIPCGGEEVRVSISLGIAELGAAGESLDELLHQSDCALYEAKRTGRNCVRTFKKEMDS
jgi:diguanylate cyclase (GGDEF)-like protein